MERALKNRENAGEWERDVYANYINDLFFAEIDAGGKGIALQFSIGAEPLPFETGSKLRVETLFELAGLFSRYPRVKFLMNLSSTHQNQAACTLARELPNFSLEGYWWHSFFPLAIRQVMSERLDMVPANKQLGFFSDAYCMDWAYAKAVIVKKQLAEVLSEKIAQGQYDETRALGVARQILNETPQMLLGMKPGI
jgi:hypothetical protein